MDHHDLRGGIRLTGTFMSAAVFTAAESAIAKLTLVFLLGSRCLFGRRVAGRPGSRGSHLCGLVGLNASEGIQAGSSQARNEMDDGGMVP